MLKSDECATIRADYDRISRAHFLKSYFCPDGMCFARSDALFPPNTLTALIAEEYQQQCRTLCYGPFPTWDQVQGQFQTIRGLL